MKQDKHWKNIGLYLLCTYNTITNNYNLVHCLRNMKTMQWLAQQRGVSLKNSLSELELQIDILRFTKCLQRMLVHLKYLHE